MQDQMQQLLQLFHTVIESSKDYRITTISHIGYATIIGKYNPDITDPDKAAHSLVIDKVMPDFLVNKYHKELDFYL